MILRDLHKALSSIVSRHLFTIAQACRYSIVLGGGWEGRGVFCRSYWHGRRFRPRRQ